MAIEWRLSPQATLFSTQESAAPMIPANKGKKFPAEPLTAEEVRALLNACSKRAPTGIRNRSLLAVLYRGGLRLGEALALLPKDLNAEAGTIRILRGKGGKSRLIGLDAGAWAILQVWLERRTQLGIGGRSRVFCTLDGQPLQASYVRTMMPRLARKAGLVRRVHPHCLRHSHAYELAGEGVPMHILQSQLGHSNLSTTSRYVAHLNPTAVIETMRSREWSL
jgi:site-specific recombinase XerD